MRSCFAVFCPDFKFASHLREKTEAISIAENRFDRDSNGIVDTCREEDILEMGGVGKMVFHSSEGSETQIQYLELVSSPSRRVSAHSHAPEQPSMIGTAFLSLAHTIVVLLKEELEDVAMRSSFAIFCLDFKAASHLREKAEGSSIAENRFDRVSSGIVDALKDFEHILEMGGVGKRVFT
ncbi:hypothetical protein V6N11_071150 [Hibiscus sabdariffa]|uniref:Uncharacterized protein n=1 Tax=Hibiscus sabdariffa TaxID=183260 RepID=A0ABR2TZ78_9ROSI